MLAGVRLHHLTEAWPTLTPTPVPGNLTRYLPQTRISKPAPKRLTRNPQPVRRRQLLARQRRTEVIVMLLVQRQRTLPIRRRKTTVRRTTPKTMHNTRVALALQTTLDPPDLTYAQLQQTPPTIARLNAH